MDYKDSGFHPKICSCLNMAVRLALQRSVTARFESRLANVHKNLQELTYIKAYVGIQAHVSNVPKREEECKSIQ